MFDQRAPLQSSAKKAKATSATKAAKAKPARELSPESSNDDSVEEMEVEESDQEVEFVPQFKPGATVIVQGLTRKEEWNGKNGVIVEFDTSQDRYKLCMVEDGQQALVREHNIRLVKKASPKKKKASPKRARDKEQEDATEDDEEPPAKKSNRATRSEAALLVNNTNTDTSKKDQKSGWRDAAPKPEKRKAATIAAEAIAATDDDQNTPPEDQASKRPESPSPAASNRLPIAAAPRRGKRVMFTDTTDEWILEYVHTYSGTAQGTTTGGNVFWQKMANHRKNPGHSFHSLRSRYTKVLKPKQATASRPAQANRRSKAVLKDNEEEEEDDEEVQVVISDDEEDFAEQRRQKPKAKGQAKLVDVQPEEEEKEEEEEESQDSQVAGPSRPSPRKPSPSKQKKAKPAPSKKAAARTTEVPSTVAQAAPQFVPQVAPQGKLSMNYEAEEDETITCIAAELGVDPNALLQHNIDRYPTVTLTSAFYAGTLLKIPARIAPTPLLPAPQAEVKPEPPTASPQRQQRRKVASPAEAAASPSARREFEAHARQFGRQASPKVPNESQDPIEETQDSQGEDDAVDEERAAFCRSELERLMTATGQPEAVVVAMIVHAKGDMNVACEMIRGHPSRNRHHPAGATLRRRAPEVD